jgi:hypothetical protein
LEWMTNCFIELRKLTMRLLDAERQSAAYMAHNLAAWKNEGSNGQGWCSLLEHQKSSGGGAVAGCLGLKTGLEFLDSVYFREMSARETTAAVNSILVYCFTQFMFRGWEGTGREVCSSLYRHVALCR